MLDEIDKVNKFTFNLVFGLIVGIMLILMLPFELLRVLVGKGSLKKYFKESIELLKGL